MGFCQVKGGSTLFICLMVAFIGYCFSFEFIYFIIIKSLIFKNWFDEIELDFSLCVVINIFSIDLWGENQKLDF